MTTHQHRPSLPAVAQQCAAKQLPASRKHSTRNAFASQLHKTSAATQPMSNTVTLAAKQGKSTPRPVVQQDNAAISTALSSCSQAALPTVQTDGQPISSCNALAAQPSQQKAKDSFEGASTAQPSSQKVKPASRPQVNMAI